MSIINNNAPQSRTFLWCVPRSVSTSLTLCLSGISDIEIGWEPFNFCDIAKIDARVHLGESLPTEYIDNEELYRKTGEIMSELNGVEFDPELLS